MIFSFREYIVFVIHASGFQIVSKKKSSVVNRDCRLQFE
jgi:hypothetical protein